MIAKHTLQAIYEKLAHDGNINPDAAQAGALEKLQALKSSLESRKKRKLFQKSSEEKSGFYIYGDVGRGKTMVMDLFYDNLHITGKQRIHFHSFMLDVHEKLKKLRASHAKNPKLDPVVALAESIAQHTKILCLDEMQVADVADALLLRRLFSKLLELGMTVVFTSNREPEDLYRGAVQRDRFLEFAKMIHDKLEVIKLESKGDYRQERLRSLKQVYFTPLGKNSHDFVDQVFRTLMNGHKPAEETITVQGRKLHVPLAAGEVARFSFSDLCEKPLGTADYREIGHRFKTVILSDVPRLTPEKRNEAKRFVNLIDELYDKKVKLVLTAEAEPESLYPEGDGSFEFRRTASRLKEMQSADYLGY